MLQRIIPVLSCVLLAHPSLAQTGDKVAEKPPLSMEQIERIRKNPRAAIEANVKSIYRANRAGVFDAQVLETIRQRTTAGRRAQHIKNFLLFDLNDNLSLEASEIETASRHLGSDVSRTALASVLRADLDEDGALSRDEILKAANERAEAMRQTAYTNMRRLFAFDENGDGAVTPVEVGAAIRRIAAMTQEDLAKREAAERDEAEQRKARNLAEQCAYPAPSENALILLLSGHYGGGLSTATIAGQDSVTTVASLHVEPGERPIYLVALSSGGLIWKVDGAVERLEAFVMDDRSRSSGAVGPDREIIRIVRDKACLPRTFAGARSGGALLARGKLSAFLGREPNRTLSGSLLGEIYIPSGAHTGLSRDPIHRGSSVRTGGIDYILTATEAIRLEGPRAETPQRRLEILEQRLLGGFPAGVVEIDPIRVFASKMAERYEVLPAEAGLLQLARAGSIEITPEGHFRIVKPIPRLPAGLHGAAKVRLILARGVPMPDGDTSFSALYLEESGECVSRFGCP